MVLLPTPQTYTQELDYEAWFWNNVSTERGRKVLEVGTSQVVPGQSIHSIARFPNVRREDYVLFDKTEGADVDVVGDIHSLPETWSDRFNAFIAIGVWEHLQRPWVAAREVARALAPGGAFLVVSHHTFPVHGDPSDYFRFSRDALRQIFEDAGLVVEASDYKNRCIVGPGPSIMRPEDVEGWNAAFPSYIHVGAAGYKRGGSFRPSPARPAAAVAASANPAAIAHLEDQTQSRDAAAGAGDLYESKAPSYQNAIDLLPGWSHAFPPALNLRAGSAPMFNDSRITWAVEQYGSLEGKHVLELGPLEGSHTWLLERLGAARIDAVEANKTAFLRCLVAKEIYGMRVGRFHLGDFMQTLQTPQRYDLIVACGVLYHMSDPLLLIERMAARSDALFLWTHYFDDAHMPLGDVRRGAFLSPEAPHQEVTATGWIKDVEMTMHLRSYHRGWSNSKFCGGPVDKHYWLEKNQLIAALRALGFNDLRLSDEQPDHVNGPAFSVFARRA